VLDQNFQSDLRQDVLGETKEEGKAGLDEGRSLSLLTESCRLFKGRETEQEYCGTHSVHGRTAVVTQDCCWASQPRSRWSWGDLDYSSVFGQ
jgi:hypothetical protein